MRTVSRFAVLLMASTLLAACQKQEEAAPEPRPVLSIVAAAEPAARLTLPGTIQARIETDFSFRVLGRIVAREVQTGDMVKKGDVLAAIDPLALELAVRSAQSDLANSQAQLVNAVATEGRQQELFQRQSGSKATLETAQMQRKTAEAAVAKSQANLDKANEQLGYARLLAEFDGVVTATSAEVGQVVSAGQSVVTVAGPDQRDAVIDVPEAAGSQVTPGSAFDVSLQLDPTVHARGTVREIAPEADNLTRTRRTKITLVNPPEALRLGSVITATAVGNQGAVIRIPGSAIRIDGTTTKVWIVDESKKAVFSRPVELDGPIVIEGSVTVSDGINPGDRIVIAGVNTLQEGQTIRVEQETSK